MNDKLLIRSYRDLLIWQKSMAMVTEIYRLSRSFPKEEIYGLTAQIRRAAVSIPSNIAEGFGRYSKTDYVRFLQIAAGSLFELQTQLEISRNLGFVEERLFNKFLAQTRELERMLGSLIVKLKRFTKPSADV